MILDLPTYRQLAKDFTSYDGDCTNAIEQAQALAEQETGRIGFDQAVYTETCQVFSNRKAYPSAYPISAVSAPTGATFDAKSVSVSSSLGLDFILGYPWGVQTYSQLISYTGGYPSGTAPKDLQQAVARIAKNLLPADTDGIPHGATSISVGDLSISLGAGHDPTDPIDAVASKILTGYRRPRSLVC